MRISIVIPAFNEELLIAESLASVRTAMTAFERRDWETELVVCDNNSTDRTSELARAAGAIVVFEPINQIARARNAGAAAATGDWLVFVDADSRPSVELFGDVAGAIAGGQCLAGGATVQLEGHYPILGRTIFIWNWISRARRWFAGSFIFCDAKSFRELGGFSNELFVAEEIDLSKRMNLLARMTGKKVIILHRHPLITSARKFHLYTAGEQLRFLARSILQSGKTFRSRKQCYPWYDGRR